MKKRTLLIAAIFVLNINFLYAEKLATVLKGQIIANNLSGIEVFIKESDGSILDMTDISASGFYELDLTIMDTPSQSEVSKLIIEVKSKSGAKKEIQLNQYLNIFDDTVLLKPIVLK